MKPAHDPNRQQSTTPVRPTGPPAVRPTSAPLPSQLPNVPTTNTSHIITGNPNMPTIKTIAATATRVVPHTSTTLTLVGAGNPNLRPVSSAPGVTTSFHVSKVQTTPTNITGPRGTGPGPMMRNIVTTPVVTHTGSGTPTSFVPGIRALTRPPGNVAAVSTTGSSTWSPAGSNKGVTAPTKITTSLPAGTSGPRPPTSLTVAARPMAGQAVRPELATLRTTKPVGPSDKFIRTPTRTTLAFATTSGQPGSQFTPQSGTAVTHLAVTPLAATQASPVSGTALTLQPIVVSTTSSAAGSAKTPAGTPGRQGALHPIGPKVITQPAHGHIITHLAGVGAKASTPAGSTTRGPAPQTQAGTPFTATPGGTQVKVLAQAPGTILTDVLTQPGGTTTTLIPSGSVFIQATPHPVNVTPLERGTVVTSASYALPTGYYYDATAGGTGLIATAPAHSTMGHAGTPHQLIRTFTPTLAQPALQVQPASTFQHSDDSARKGAFFLLGDKEMMKKSNTIEDWNFIHAVDGRLTNAYASNVTTTGSSLARFNPVMVMDTSNRPSSTSQSEGPSTEPPGGQQPPVTSSHSSSHQATPGQQQQSQLASSSSHLQSQSPAQSSFPVSTTASQSVSQSAPQQSQPCSMSLQQHQHPSSHQSGPSILPGTSAPSTPTSTPNKFSASPRPSILRKREHDGTPSKVQKNLGPMLAALARDMPGSPPPSPPGRPDSRDGKDGNGGHSSAGSSTISATSSPGLPCDGDNNGGSQSGMMVKSEPADVGDGGSNNGTNGNSDIMSPRKKPRKQQLTGNELQEPPYSDENAEFAEDKVKKEGGDANHKAGQEGLAPNTPVRGAGTPARRRPSVSLLQTYRTCWKPRNNHFIRPTDVRPREERRLTVAELSSQKRVVQRAQGWKLHHLSTQMEDMVEREADVLSKLSEVLETMESSQPNSEATGKDLNSTNELIRSNIQRSKVVRDQLEECRIQLLRLLDHSNPVVDIIKRNANRRQAKKKY